MLQFPTDLKYVKEASKKVLDLLGDLDLDESTLFDIKLCFEEAFINAIKHGNKYDSDLTVEFDVVIKENELEIIVCDHGEGFDFSFCEDPTEEKHLKRTHGRGLYLIQRLMNKVFYNKTKKRLHMIKRIR